MEKDLEEVLYTEEQIDKKVTELAAQITKDYEGKDPIMICVLTGAVFFFSDLFKKTKFPVYPDFIICSSYAGKKSTGNLTITKDLKYNIEGRHVIIVEDIVDTGLTIYELRKNLLERNPASLKICTLFNKKVKKAHEIPLDYVGFDLEDKFIVGYGLDYNNFYRNMPIVGVLKEEIYNKWRNLYLIDVLKN